MTYSQNANPNATNSELDAKKIVNNVQLNDDQIYDIIKQYVEIKVDRMDTQELVEHVSENLRDWYSDFSLEELESVISGDDEELFDELVDNVTNPTVLDINNTGGKY